MQSLPSTVSILGTYDGWAGQRRVQALNDLNSEGAAYRDTRLGGDTTFSRDEVASILNGQQQTLVAAAVKDQEHLAACVRALLVAVFQQTDRQRVPVEVDATSALNRGVQLTAFELAEQKLAAKTSGGPRLGALPPVGGDAAMQKQLAEAHEEIRRLNERMRAMQQQYSSAMEQKSEANQNMLVMQDTLQGLEANAAEMTVAQRQELQTQNQQFRAEVERLQAAAKQSDAQHAATIAKLQQDVASARNELGLKLAQSSQFQSMKQMVVQKNQVVQQLRSSLARYDPAAAAALGGADDIEAEDDDDD